MPRDVGNFAMTWLLFLFVVFIWLILELALHETITVTLVNLASGFGTPSGYIDRVEMIWRWSARIFLGCLTIWAALTAIATEEDTVEVY